MRVYLGANNFRVLKPITIMAESMAHLNNHRKHNSLVSLDCSLKFDILILLSMRLLTIVTSFHFWRCTLNTLIFFYLFLKCLLLCQKKSCIVYHLERLRLGILMKNINTYVWKCADYIYVDVPGSFYFCDKKSWPAGKGRVCFII